MTKLLALAAAVTMALAPGVASASDLATDLTTDLTTADTRPPGCSHHFKDPNPRQRTIIRDTNMHEMSNPPVCAPHGPYIGALRAGSTFIVYYADPYAPLWCYGYSWQIARTGYILCEAYD